MVAGDAEDLYWVMLPEERIDDAFPLHWLGWGAASLVLTLLALVNVGAGAFWMHRLWVQTKP